MSNPIIEIVITDTGDTTVQTKGFVGASCRQASQFMEQALGETASETLMSEFHETIPAQQQIQQR